MQGGGAAAGRPCASAGDTLTCTPPMAEPHHTASVHWLQILEWAYGESAALLSGGCALELGKVLPLKCGSASRSSRFTPGCGQPPVGKLGRKSAVLAAHLLSLAPSLSPPPQTASGGAAATAASWPTLPPRFAWGRAPRKDVSPAGLSALLALCCCWGGPGHSPQLLAPPLLLRLLLLLLLLHTAHHLQTCWLPNCAVAFVAAVAAAQSNRYL